MDNRLNSEMEIIENALNAYPVAELPNDVASLVMEKIRIVHAPRLRISLNNLLLAAALILAVCSIWYGFEFLPATALIKLRILGRLFWYGLRINAPWLLPLLIVTFGASLAGIAVYQTPHLQRK
jgi:hypothetical protein